MGNCTQAPSKPAPVAKAAQPPPKAASKPAPSKAAELAPAAPKAVAAAKPAPAATSQPKEVPKVTPKPASVLDGISPEQRVVMDQAANRIQRLVRKNSAFKTASIEQQWKLFADLDTQDEAEMLHLAVFMQTLIDCVPGAKNEETAAEMHSQLAEESLSLLKQPSAQVAVEDIRLEDKEYDLGDREMTPSTAAEILEVYRTEGKLSRTTILKVVRRAYKLLLTLPNTNRLTILASDQLTVVGDLHGQFSDFLHILDTSGAPSVTNKYIFNGDFVDRGDKGLEIIVCLFAFLLAYGPTVIALNRGNHEDLTVCRVYGFEAEVKAKYDEMVFEMIAEVFNHLPLFTVANDSLFVVHGGLFHNAHATLADLEEINRKEFVVKPPVPYPENTKGLAAAEVRKEYLKQLQRDALWSDPKKDIGVFLNPRGAGVTFGPDTAEHFMTTNNLAMVIRSHECIRKGFDLPFLNPLLTSADEYLEPIPRNATALKKAYAKAPLLATLFSASNYIGGNNEGAIVILRAVAFDGSRPTTRNPNLHYLVKRYKANKTVGSLQNSTQSSLTEMIIKKKGPLTAAFEAKDTQQTGQISRLEWAEVMQHVTGIKIRWLSVLPTIAPPEATTSNAVLYRKFLSHFAIKGSDGAAGGLPEDYGPRKRLEQIFGFFDADGNGVSCSLMLLCVSVPLLSPSLSPASVFSCGTHFSMLHQSRTSLCAVIVEQYDCLHAGKEAIGMWWS